MDLTTDIKQATKMMAQQITKLERWAMHKGAGLAVLLIANLFLVSAAIGQTTTLATYYFENNITAQAGAIGSPTLTSSNTGYSNTTFCQGSYSISSGTNGAYIELTISTSGYSNIGVSWIGRRSSSSTNSWLLTADSGSGYGLTLYTQTNSTTCTTIPTQTLSDAFNDNSSIKIRITLSRASGTGYLDQLLITGTACSLPSITCPPAVSGFVNPATGIIAAYPFNETGATTTAKDVIGGKNGTLTNGPTWNTGKYGNAVYLDGSNDYVALPTGIVSSLSGNYSVSTWVYLNNNTQWTRIFDFGTGTTNYMFLTPRGGNNTISFAIRTASINEQIINGTAALPTGGWHHVVVTLQGSTGTIYVDGTAVGTNTGMTLNPSELGNTNQNYIGESQWPDPLLNGRIDEFRIYNIALSGAQVTELYNKTTACEIASDFGTVSLGTPTVTGGCGAVTLTNDAAFPLTPGSHTITWTATDASSNSSSCTQSVTVIPSTITFTGSLADQCAGSTTYALTGGSPAGGTYSGNGVTGTNFDASVAGIGTHTITYSYIYTYADGTSCPGSATNTIKVNSSPTAKVLGQTNVSCNAGNDGTITIEVLNGTGPNYEYSVDNGVTWKTSTDNPYIYGGLEANKQYKIVVKDTNCQSILIP